jgi:hypothetical protein
MGGVRDGAPPYPEREALNAVDFEFDAGSFTRLSMGVAPAKSTHLQTLNSSSPTEDTGNTEMIKGSFKRLRLEYDGRGLLSALIR